MLKGNMEIEDDWIEAFEKRLEMFHNENIV